MKILLTGANGYIGKRLLPVLLEDGHDIYCLVRDRNRLAPEMAAKPRVHICVADLLDRDTLEHLPKDIDIAYFMVHSMSHNAREFPQMEAKLASNFTQYLESSSAKQVIYLSGISNDKNLSRHLESRKQVESILYGGKVPVTILRAAIIIGSGSASFEIIRDLVEKLPVMVAPRWLNTRCQPIAVHDVVFYLRHVVGDPRLYNQSFDIGGPDILTYKEMLLKFAAIRNLRRFILTIPVLTPRLSSYWLYFVTSTSFSLARTLVDSMKNEVICRDHRIKNLIPYDCLSYDEAVKRAFSRIEENAVISSWKDAWISGTIHNVDSGQIQIPQQGCFTDRQKVRLPAGQVEEVVENIWSIGGKRGWYYMNPLWLLRGILDKVIGGVGLRRGRTHPNNLRPGDALDFWRVLLADREDKRLLLFAEMKLPGEAWLEFNIVKEGAQSVLVQTATFRPKGLSGRLYWILIYPFHKLIFKGMPRRIVAFRS